MGYLRSIGITFDGTPPFRQLSEMILEHPLDRKYNHLIIDEAQDFSESDFRVFNLLAENITVFADSNQQLYDHGIGDIEKIKSLLHMERDSHFDIKENHRNTKQIVDFMRVLATDNSNTSQEATRFGEKPIVWGFPSTKDENAKIAEIVSENPEASIGILHREKDPLSNLYNELSRMRTNLRLELQPHFNFMEDHPKLVTLNSAKGLEFDIVIMPRFTRDYYYRNPINRKRIYTGVSRARKQLFITHTASNPTEYVGDFKPGSFDHR